MTASEHGSSPIGSADVEGVRYSPAEENISKDLQSDLSALLNRHSRENTSNTPDFVLASFMMSALRAYEETVRWRDALKSKPPMSEVFDEPRGLSAAEPSSNGEGVTS